MIPKSIYIGLGEDASKLYELEERRSDYILECADELVRLSKKHKHLPQYKDRWDALPQALFDTLESFSASRVEEALTGFLVAKGFSTED